MQPVNRRVLRRRPEGENIEEAVTEPQNGAFVQVEDVLPALGRVDDFSDEGLLEAASAGAGFDGGEDGVAGFGDHGFPVLFAVQLDSFPFVLV